MSTNIKTWYDFVLQQMAAESYLNQATLFGGPESTTNVLLFGSNNPFYQRQQGYDPTKDILPGATRMTATQVDDFLRRYAILDHRGNDDPRFANLGANANGVNVLVGNGSGLSATLMLDNDTGEYTLSIRSTEFFNPSQGGDWLRDGLGGADGEIGSKGFALGQLEALEEYYQTLKASGLLPAGATLNVTGYSLSGHLATVFSQLHPAEVNNTFVFNSPGQGSWDASKGTLSDVLASFQQALSANLAAGGQTSVLEKNLYATQFDSDSHQNVPVNTYYAAAVAATKQKFGLSGESAWNTVTGGTGQTINFGATFMQFYGQGAHNDATHVANTGIHDLATQALFIEDQPDVQGWVLFGENADFGTTHSITLIVDSLAVMAALEKIGFDMSTSDAMRNAYNMLAGASNERATGFIGTDGLELKGSASHYFWKIHATSPTH